MTKSLELISTQKMPKGGLGSMQGQKFSSYGFEPTKIFGSQYLLYQLENLSAVLLSQAHQKLSSSKGRLSPRSSSTGGHLPLMVVFH